MLFTFRSLSITVLLSLPFIAHAQIQIHDPVSFPSLSPKEKMAPLYAAAPVSKQQAAGIAQQQVPGRVLTVSLEGSVYRVKIVSASGDVVNVFIDSNTGEILN